MPLKVIGAGYGRTGTMSTYSALKQLGFPCYHMIEVLQNKANKTHLDFWRMVANSPPGTKHDWEQALSQYTAAVDNPTCCVFRTAECRVSASNAARSLPPFAASPARNSAFCRDPPLFASSEVP